ncbi:centrosome-associated zinc finger protein Cp190 [Drosophila tropicalis]|uniref:centrosome-associated zinc finger protein Cp190 n=1 Tax=Drosophila tropicalis TaxID=46794 RepID=UPI0035AB70B6
MGEVKSVKVDNWGVFFLQKLQNFFNKTDYCDLTLQFRDNSQLKVHRLVLSACTDYFNVLEQTCEIIDDALIMPNEFQADVVVPIVNFMYTGTLEFELKMYGKLLRTAKEMNMTVLLKLLEAHRRTMENVNRQQRPPSPKGVRRRTVVGPGSNVNAGQQQVTTGTRVGQVPSIQSRGIVNTPNQRPQINTQRPVIGGGLQRTVKPEVTSPFEQLRKGYNNNKRPAQPSLLSPPSKKLSLEEVKEFAEQQRMRKQIAAEYGDHDPDYDGGLPYDDVHAGDDDDDDMPPQPSTSKQQQQQTTATSQQTTLGTTTIIVKQDSPSQTPTIIVKDSSNTKLNHTKIIAEVLRQYPHIVKGHKNIKLKIMPSSPIEKSSPTPAPAPAAPAPAPVATSSTSPHKKLHVSFKSDKSTPMITTQPKAPLRESQVQQQQQKPATPVSAPATNTTLGHSSSTPAQKRRIDSKTMHALIAQGPENTTGPWLCLRCGVNGRPISIPSYRGFRRHLINTHKETIDPNLCEHCGWRSSNNRELHFHMQTEHQIKSLLYTFADCVLCNQSYLTKDQLEAHINESHTDDEKQQCIYCNKVFEQELQLYRHMKNSHKAQALEDGIIDETDEEYLGSQVDEEEESQTEQEELQQDEGKVRILSDISLPTTHAIPLQQQQSELDANLEQIEQQEVKFVGADGNEVELTDEQRKEILSQLNQQQAGAPSGGVVMVLSEPEAAEEKLQEGEVGEADGNKSQAGTEEDEYDDSQIYNELAGDSVESKKSEGRTVADESKESMDNLEWAENLISEQEMEAEQEESKEPKQTDEKRSDDISEKLKELTGDWSEDENEEEDDAVIEAAEADKPATAEIAVEVASSMAKQPNDDEATQIRVDEPAPAAMEVDQEQEEADDIDLALESLHKGIDKDTTAAVSTPIEVAKPAQESEQTDAPANNVLEAKQAETVQIKREDDSVEEEFIKEDPTQEPQSNAVEAAVEDLETENIRKELLDELMAQAEKTDEEKQPSPEEPETTIAAATTTVEQVDGTAITAATELSPETDEVKPNTEEESEANKISATSDQETREEQAKPSIDDLAAAATEEDVVAAVADNNVSVKSPAATETATAKTLTEEVEATSDVDKVKSLISDWVDEDEEEDENAVSAAAKEEL